MPRPIAAAKISHVPHLCPLCARDESTTEDQTDDGVRYVACTDRSHGPDGYVWEPSPPPGRSLRGDGLGSELGIWDKLLELFEPGADFVAYGEMEDRFVDRFPSDAQLLLHRYGHKFRDPDHKAGRYSMSVYLSCRLRELNKEGQLELAFREATGDWAYNGVISHWRLARPG